MKKDLLLVLLFGIFGSSLAKATVRCDAFAGVNRYHFAVELNRETGQLTVTTDDGSIVSGPAAFTTSVRGNAEYIFLGSGFGIGYELQIPDVRRGGDARLCLKATECYPCR